MIRKLITELRLYLGFELLYLAMKMLPPSSWQKTSFAVFMSEFCDREIVELANKQRKRLNV